MMGKTCPSSTGGSVLRLGAMWLIAALIAFALPCSPALGTEVCPIPAQYPQMARFEQNLVTPHFILRWTTRSDNQKENILDRSILVETGEYLETAWQKYSDEFGRTPYVAPGRDRIDVIFCDIGCYGEADPPESPIRFDAYSWKKKPGIRRPTSSHELFHKLQYSFGYRSRWQPTGDRYRWFSEGTAAWAEVFVWQRVSGEHKLQELFQKPDIDLYDSEDASLPIWLFLQHRMAASGLNPVRELLESYEKTGKESLALSQVVQSEFGSIENFFAAFAQERYLCTCGATPQTPALFGNITGPAGNGVVARLNIKEVSMDRRGNYGDSGRVSRLGSKYYRIRLGEKAVGKRVTLSVGSRRGAQSCYLALEKNGQLSQGTFLAGVQGKCGFSRQIEPGSADSLLVIVSGYGKDGAYSLNASLN